MTKSIIGWVGGKSKLMWLINLLAPPMCERTIDVFGGSATVTLNLENLKPSLKIYNDFNRDLVNLLQCARDKPLALMKEIGFLTLNSRDDFEQLKKFLELEEFTETDLFAELELTEIMFDPLTAEELRTILFTKAEQKDVKRAAVYFKVLRYSFNANGESYGGKKCDVRNFSFIMWQFYRAFADVAVENKDFEALIKQYDRKTAFVYCDPPYFEAEGVYAVNFPKSDHERLHTTLANAEGYVMVSYNNAEYITDLYSDFYIFHTTRPNSMSHKQGELYEELIMTNYDPREFIKDKTSQLNLFGEIYDDAEGNYTIIHEPLKPLRS